MDSNKKPMIKLKIGSKPAAKEEASSPVSSSATPTTKLKLKFAAPKPDTSTGSTAKSSTAAESSKPKTLLKLKPPKATEASKKGASEKPSKKRAKSDNPSTQAAPKKLKLSISKPVAPALKLKHKGRPPPRPLGVGYDSEASDREEDPAIEEEFMLRMEPGEDCDYLRQAIEERRFGPVKEGGADVQMKFLSRDGRRATVTIRGHIYAASLVDLPCIVEGMKSWDKRGWYKTADISQMLLVLGRVKTEEEARSYPLPKEINPKTWQFAHGLTPPMHWVRKRRFRQRLSYNAIEEVEREVALLLKRDEEAVESNWETIDTTRRTREASTHQPGFEASPEYDYEQDADGDAEGEADDYMYAGDGESGNPYENSGMDAEGDDNDDLAADLEAAFAEGPDDDADEASTPAIMAETPQYYDEGGDSGSMAASPADMSTPFTKATSGDESSGEDDEDDEDDDDDDEDAASIDEDAREREANIQQQREEIADLEAAISTESVKLSQQTNQIIKQKMYKKIQSLKEDLAIKKAAIGEGDD